MATNNEVRAKLCVGLVTASILMMIALGGCREHAKKDNPDSAIKLARGFGLAIKVRASVIAFHQKLGRWPASNDEVRLPRPEQYADDLITSLTISGDGNITVRFKAGETLRLEPDTRHAPIGARWRCKTTEFENPARTVPCKPMD
jgi:hypothetical protein